VIEWERRVLLKHYLDEGLTPTEIARELGISRQTIHRWVRSGELDRDVSEFRYKPRPPAPTKLDPYKPIIQERLAEFRELTAVRWLEEIKAAGYPGGYTQCSASEPFRLFGCFCMPHLSGDLRRGLKPPLVDLLPSFPRPL